MIELDELLNGTPSWEQVVEFFNKGEFYQEHYLVEAIENHLQTEEQRQTIFDNHMSIEKMLNGRTSCEQRQISSTIFNEWNSKLGYQHFRG